MTLATGTRLGPYEILAPLGAGGMGEVYKARDRKLDRDVAIKVLPQSVATDLDTLARFEREAKAVAALSHPNILAIHDFGRQEGTAYAVMELLEGETLRGKLDTGPIPQKQAVDYALQVAKGLSAAHEKGIVHRDLKPENLFVSRDGHLKILDFGLAKRVEAVAPGKETSAPTGSGHTQPGTVMGTVGYMSPEQVKGLPVDHRSDIFSFGTILYELLSGKRAFQGDTSAETMAAIMRDEPPDLSEAGRSISPALDRIVKHCLEKDRDHRFQSARDIAFNLSEQFAPTATGGPRETAPPIGSTGLWVAVLPFQCGGANADLAALADGISEEIGTGLSRFRYLSVVASASAARLKGVEGDERALGAKLGARYVLEGSIRGGGSAIRVSAQLVDAQTGAQLWSETFNRVLEASSVFEAQDDIAARIVATVADSYGVLVHAMRSAIRQKDDAHLTPLEWQFQYFAYREQITPSAHAELKSRLERAVERDDRQSDLWACLAQVFVDEYAFGFRSDATSLDRALAAARRGVELDRANQFALVALAQTHFFRQDLAAFGPAAERAMALNPLNTDAVGILGLQIVHTGEFERGAAIVRRAMELNPNHAGWMHFAPLWEHFHKGEYEQALERANRVDVPGLFWPYLVMASACGHLGRSTEAAAAVRDLLTLDPEFAAHARSNVGTWHFASGLMEPILEGLRKAGLELPVEEKTAVAARAPVRAPVADSGAARADEGFWVAVLPFKHGGTDAALAALAEGLTEGIVTGLSRFSYLRVISRASGGKQLGARYVMEGSLRQAGAKLRLAVQLVDTVSGAHLWAEDYERTFAPGAAFELQDDLVPRIVSTVADQYGVLVHSMSESLRGRSAGEYSAHEAVLRAFGYWERVTPEEHGEVREILEAAVARAPGHSNCLAELSLIYWHEYAFGYNLRPDPLGRARAAAQRAVASAPTSHFAHSALATALFFQKDFPAFRPAAERALALNRMDASTAAILGTMIAYAGDWEFGLGVVERAMQLNPHHPGWYRYVGLTDAYRRRDYRGALASALKVNMPGYYWPHVLLAAVYGQLGEQQRAGAALRELHALMPDFGAMAREEFGKWHDAELTEHLLDGLRKAGLEIPPEKGTSAAAHDLARPSTTDSGAARADEGFWVAVLPFKYGGADASLKTLAEGLTEEVATGLSRFSYLKVISRGSAPDAQSAGKELGARYIMEGSLRQAGTRLRLAVQLVDAVSGAHLWAENYERTFSPEAVFELQDELVPRIVSTVADMHGVLPRSMSEVVRLKSADQMSPYEALLRSFGYNERFTPEDLAEVRTCLERAVQQSPGNAECWAMLSLMYANEYGHWDNARPDSLDRSLRAARTAVEAAPTHSLPYYALAQALFFKREIPAFRVAAERAVSLNPMDGATAAFMGLLIAYAGDWERGCALSDKGSQLNPNHPGWYRYTAWHDAYRKKDYRKALDVALHLNAPKNYYTHAVLAICYAQLGQMEEARKALRDMLALKPNYAEVARELHGRWIDPDLVEQLMNGLRKAGLEIRPETGASATAHGLARPSAADSGAARAEEGFWVAVLPFRHGGTDSSVTALAEGLTEEIVTGLSRFSYLKVIARSSTSRYAHESVDVRSAGKDLGARYVMEGTLRQAGGKLRLAVQLLDALSGAHLWAENYERTFSPEAVFELQDDLVPRIVSTVADMHGVLPRTMSEALRSRTPEQLSPYEAVLRSFGYSERVTPEELAGARTALELAVERAPAYADAWAMLAWLCIQDYAQGFNLQADSLASGLTAAQRAVEAAPSNPLAQFSLAQALFFRREFQGFRNAAERAVALNPMNGDSIAFLGELLTYAGDSKRGLELAGRAKQLNPHHPGWYWYADFYDAYRRGDDRRALDAALKVNLPGQWFMHAALAAAYGQLGERGAATKAVQDLLRVRPEFAATVRKDIQKWWEPEYVERMIDGWRKAGLEIPGEKTTAAPEAAVAVAVLPFTDMSAAKDQDYLCEGMAEEIMNALVRVGGIRVASRTSAFQARRQGADLPAIGKLLSVGQVLEGSVRTAGDRLRVTAQLTDVASGFQLWSERFDRRAEDVFAVQDEIAMGVVDAVKARLSPGEHAVPARPQPANLEAYRNYLRGRHLRGKEHHDGALRAFEEAVRLDPSHAPSWTGLAEITVLASVFGLIPAREACATARKALSTATRMQGESAEGLHVEAFVAWIEGRWPAMEAAWRRAIELQPANVLALASFGIALCTRQRLDEALPLLERARQADPLASFPYTLTGGGLLNCGRPQEALRYLEDALSFEKEDATALDNAGMARVALGRLEEGIATLEHVVAVSHRGAHFLGTLGWALATAGRKDEARTIHEELRARPPGAPAVVSEAWLLGALGELDAAFEVVARAEDECLAYLYFTGLPGFDPLRADPRFAALLERLGLPSA